jgi:antitoxin component YwqK of YwqJK toxin-antitoxin module
MKIRYFLHNFLLCSLLLLSPACTHKKQFTMQVQDPPCLTGISLVDRNGLSETINNAERLEQYVTVDFLTPQPYQKVLCIFSRDMRGNIPAKIYSYHPNGSLRQYLEILNGRASGTYREWHPNGTLKISARIMEGVGDLVEEAQRSWIFDGLCEAWDEKGVLIAQLPYNKGLQEGVVRYYFPDGSLHKQIPCVSNQAEGVMEIYCQNGALLQSSSYHEGKLDGPSTRFWEGMKIATEEEYSDGLLLRGRYYDSNGTCIAQVDEGNGMRAIFGKKALAELHEYHYGVLDGKVQQFDEKGRLYKSYHVKNGCKHGEEVVYYCLNRLQLQPLPKLSVSWYEGKIQGIVKTWYDNGTQESQKEWSNNKKNGHNTAWYRDGSLMMIEEYEQDILVRGEYYDKEEKVPVSTVEEGEGLATLFDAEGNFVQKVHYLHGTPQQD